MDAESETLIAHTLRGDGFDASKDGTGRGTPLVPVQVNTPACLPACLPVGFMWQSGVGGSFEEDGMGTLVKSQTPAVAIPIQEPSARTGRSTEDVTCGIGIGEADDPMYTLQSGKQHAIGYTLPPGVKGPVKVVGLYRCRDCGKDYPALGDTDPESPRVQLDGWMLLANPCPHCGGSDDNTVRYPAIPFDTTQITSEANYSNPKPGDPCHPLAAGAHPPAVAFTERTRVEGRSLECQEDLAYALTNPGSGGRTHSRQLMQGMAVRRLTPTECERLQGFPDGYTLVPYPTHTRKGKPLKRVRMAADGPRYKALGNSMAVTVMQWIGQRVDLVERFVKGRA
jgi:hypothetical protein